MNEYSLQSLCGNRKHPLQCFLFWMISFATVTAEQCTEKCLLWMK